MKNTLITITTVINSILFISALFNTNKLAWILFFVVLVISTTLTAILIELDKKKKNNQVTHITPDNVHKIEASISIQSATYHKRQFITNCEKIFLDKLTKLFGDKYIIQPQIPLRMIVYKNGEENGVYANELNRYIDIGIFDKNYEILALVELNDKTHKTKDRYERDLKVQEICKQAKIPLITFWTYGNQTDENIKYIIEKEIKNAN